MGFWSDAWRTVAGALTRSGPDASGTRTGRLRCPRCGRRAPRAPRRASARRIAAAAAEIVAYERVHADDPSWGIRDAIAQAHGLSVVDVTDETIRLRDVAARAARRQPTEGA
ncbi:hypothetical protein [Agrococcus carbonis]|uniref:Uncharacterized protein n=1 Tax=Agrococcus carbonis TaxID=684552 RepID=A0A1H1LEM6_9MICO|nr:hypothetical protein [Agrococcus carbonis]SDR73041.1 hypothetical protein SAMN04489719_0568 [Agrococcus carbonis]